MKVVLQTTYLKTGKHYVHNELDNSLNAPPSSPDHPFTTSSLSFHLKAEPRNQKEATLWHDSTKIEEALALHQFPPFHRCKIANSLPNLDLVTYSLAYYWRPVFLIPPLEGVNTPIGRIPSRNFLRLRED